MHHTFEDKFAILNELQEILLEDRMGSPVRLLMHAVLNTIPLHDLTKYFISEASHSQLVARNIARRIGEYNDKSKLYDYIFAELKSANYIDRLRLRKFMEAVIQDLDETRQQEYFSYFSNSKYIYEIRSALKVTKWIWSDLLEEKLLKLYSKTGDEYILQTLIKNIDEEGFNLLVQKVWTPDLPNRIKPMFIERLKGRTVSDLAFLQTVDPGNYIALLRYSDTELDDLGLIESYNKVPDAYKPFAIWNLGRMSKWELIKEPIQKFINNSESEFSGFFETIFD